MHCCYKTLIYSFVEKCRRKHWKIAVAALCVSFATVIYSQTISVKTKSWDNNLAQEQRFFSYTVSKLSHGVVIYKNVQWGVRGKDFNFFHLWFNVIIYKFVVREVFVCSIYFFLCVYKIYLKRQSRLKWIKNVTCKCQF